MAFNVSKINLAGSVCSDEQFYVYPLVLTADLPLCPFNFIISHESPTYLDKDEMVHNGTPSEIVWDLCNTEGMSITTFIQTENFGSFKFPSKYIEPETSYIVQAYVIIQDIGESAWSHIHVNSKFLNWSQEGSKAVINWSDFGMPTEDTSSFEYNKVVDAGIPVSVQLGVEQNVGIKLRISAFDNSTEDIATIKYEANIEDDTTQIIGGIYFDAYLQQYQDRADPFVCCGDGNGNIFIGMTFLSITAMDEGGHISTSFVRHVLFQYSLSTNQFTELTDNIETPLLNKEGYAMCVKDGMLYLIGGYQVDATGAWVSPLEEERTFLRYDPTLNVMTNMEVIGYKPRDYRACKLAVSDTGILKFGGRGKVTNESDIQNAPEMWFFEFSSKTWIAYPMFPYADYLSWSNRGNMDFGEDESGNNYNLVIKYSGSSCNWFKFHKEEKFWEIMGEFPADPSLEYQDLSIVGQYVYGPKGEMN